MKLYLTGHDYRYGVEQMMMTLFPGQRPEYPEGEPEGDFPAAAVALEQAGDTLAAHARLWWEGKVYQGEERLLLTDDPGPLGPVRAGQRAVNIAFYRAGVAALGAEPPWGALTGVRPVKLPTRRRLEGGSRAEALAELIKDYRVSPERAELAMECADAALWVQAGLGADSLSLYIGIPFCPTRCAYCSFISADVQRTLKLVEPYVDALCREIALTGRLMRERGLHVSTAYMGGGTPTTLSAEQLDRVLSAVEAHIPMEGCGEFTVEAGRPDTITPDKLETLRRHGIHRISINPQTMEDHVLRAMGRAHTAEDIEEAMALAAAHYGGMVNMDLIAGLPTDTVDGFGRTLRRVLAMGPDNITIHTLALKKGAALRERPEELCTPEQVGEMLSMAEGALRGAGYVPYYLYRQKYMSGSFENVGWCKPGTVCAYNIVMMEELQSVLSLGAGGVTKLVDTRAGKIHRLANPKFPKEYLDSWDRLAGDKARAVEFQRGLV